MFQHFTGVNFPGKRKIIWKYGTLQKRRCGRNPLGNLRRARARTHHFCNLSVPRWRKIAYIQYVQRASVVFEYIYYIYLGVRCHKYAPPVSTARFRYKTRKTYRFIYIYINTIIIICMCRGGVPRGTQSRCAGMKRKQGRRRRSQLLD